LDLVESGSVLVLNGDSYTDIDLAALITAYHQSNADVSVVVVPPDGRGDCGSVKLAADGAVLSFREKPGPLDVVYINAGIYMMSRQLLQEIPAGNSSLERELMPRWIEQSRRIQGFVHSGRCLDIGTPERYRAAQHLLAEGELEANGLHSMAQL
jgi:D-glycero-alpha-D-manno-heptose 1-phosphate guanylyltransferase